jgi:hypothetical protein
MATLTSSSQEPEVLVDPIWPHSSSSLTKSLPRFCNRVVCKFAADLEVSLNFVTRILEFCPISAVFYL